MYDNHFVPIPQESLWGGFTIFDVSDMTTHIDGIAGRTDCP
jgi:hypothetical protein